MNHLWGSEKAGSSTSRRANVCGASRAWHADNDLEGSKDLNSNQRRAQSALIEVLGAQILHELRVWIFPVV